MFNWLLRLLALRVILRPVLRFVIGLLAIPLFRMIRHRVFRLHEIDPHLERDIELWFRASLVLLVATANMEEFLFGWVPLDLQGDFAWLAIGLRLLLAVGVIELMPDQDVFALLHPGPPQINVLSRSGLREACRRWREYVHGLLCLHLRRSSPVFAIMAAIFGGPPGSGAHLIGWICYGVAVTQFLIIGLITNRDRALDLLPEIERRLTQAKREVLESLDLDSVLPASELAELADLDEVAAAAGAPTPAPSVDPGTRAPGGAALPPADEAAGGQTGRLPG